MLISFTATPTRAKELFDALTIVARDAALVSLDPDGDFDTVYVNFEDIDDAAVSQALLLVSTAVELGF